jgi:Smg protein
MVEETLLDVLMYVFEYFVQGACCIKEPKKVAKTMEKNGFHPQAIEEALAWFDSLAQQQQHLDTSPIPCKLNTFRVFSPQEFKKLSKAARTYLAWLEKAQIINASLRELIIHHVMLLREPTVEVREIKWVALIVLYASPEKKNQLTLLEDIILFGHESQVH